MCNVHLVSDGNGAGTGKQICSWEWLYSFNCKNAVTKAVYNKYVNT